MGCVTSACSTGTEDAPPPTKQQSRDRAASTLLLRGYELPSCDAFVEVRELGVGLQGRVALAYDPLCEPRRYVALKAPTFATLDGSDHIDVPHLDCQVQSLVRERDAMRLVHHDNVLRLLRSVRGRTASNHAYIVLVLEYASEGDLFDLVASGGALPEHVARFYFRQLVAAVRACHSSGVIHRDVKPENLLFDDTFTLKLCDFGLASIVPMVTGDACDAVLCDVEGTSLYMAPEIGCASPFSAAPLDVWSCGIVLFIMLTGFPPFEAAEAGDFWYECVINGDMDQFWESQPQAIERPSAVAIDLINRLLCADPARRISIQDTWSHPWLSNPNATDDEEVARLAVVEYMSQRRQLATELSLEDHSAYEEAQ